MQIDQIIAECVARKGLAPAKDPVQILSEVMDEVATFKAALAARPEFAVPGSVVNADTKAAEAAAAAAK